MVYGPRPEAKKYAIALVISGTIEAASSADARKRLGTSLGAYDFVDEMQASMKVREVKKWKKNKKRG